MAIDSSFLFLGLNTGAIETYRFSNNTSTNAKNSSNSLINSTMLNKKFNFT